MDIAAFDRILASIEDVAIPADKGGISFIVTAEEQRCVLRLYLEIYNNLENIKFYVIVGKLYQLINNPKRSRLITELFDPRCELNRIYYIRKYGTYLSNDVMIALLNLIQVLDGNFKLDRKTSRSLVFEKTVFAEMRYMEGFQSVLTQYFKEMQNTTGPLKLNFHDSKLVTINALRDRSKVNITQRINLIRPVFISTEEVYDRSIINPLRKMIAKTYIKAAMFNELNYGAENRVFNIFAKFTVK